ncbi:hypothetical protein TNCT_122251 [Trichonephila clavata]|uniref:Uncharacterized protein n=1 Tax=Trichonephila clavata TaxID=2740835 RepID=A0A8X6HLZ1_TRICU|nr:hypothetical protein TNCT_122251 [Trichonephila clavata]
MVIHYTRDSLTVCNDTLEGCGILYRSLSFVLHSLTSTQTGGHGKNLVQKELYESKKLENHCSRRTVVPVHCQCTCITVSGTRTQSHERLLNIEDDHSGTVVTLKQLNKFVYKCKVSHNL